MPIGHVSVVRQHIEHSILQSHIMFTIILTNVIYHRLFGNTKYPKNLESTLAGRHIEWQCTAIKWCIYMDYHNTAQRMGGVIQRPKTKMPRSASKFGSAVTSWPDSVSNAIRLWITTSRSRQNSSKSAIERNRTPGVLNQENPSMP